MRRKSKIILAVLITAFTVFEITALLYILRNDKGSAVVASSYVPSVSPSNPASSGSVTFHPVSTGVRHVQPIMPARTVNHSGTSHFAPTVSTGWQIYRTSSKTVHQIGGGGSGASGSSGSTNGGSSSRGIHTNSGSFSVPSLAVTSMPLAARNLQDGMTAEQGIRAAMPRRTIINDDDNEGYGDDDLRPGYDPNDPFFTPVGDIPWIFLLLLCVAFGVRKGVGCALYIPNICSIFDNLPLKGTLSKLRSHPCANNKYLASKI